jgi:hypothetical protein
MNAKLGARGAEVFSRYVVDLDGVTTPQRVIELGQGASAPNDTVPQKDANFTTSLDSQPEDASIIAEDITAKQRESGPGGRKAWWVDVTYRNPSLSGIDPQENLNPLLRMPRLWTEHLVITEDRDFGRNEKDIKWPWLDEPKFDTVSPSAGDLKIAKPAVRPGDTFGPVTNASGLRFGPYPQRQIRLPVFVFQKNVSNPYSYLPTHDLFSESMNSTPWKIYDQPVSVKAGSAAFMGMTTSKPKFWGSLTYYELQSRVVYDSALHFIRQRNEGIHFWKIVKNAAGEDEYRFGVNYSGGIPVQPPTLLNIEGELRDRTNPADVEILKFFDLKELDYSALTMALAGLG